MGGRTHTIACTEQGELVTEEVPTVGARGQFRVHDETCRNPSVLVAGRFVVTHIPTGFVVGRFARRSDALAAAAWAAAAAPEGGLFTFGRIDPEGSPGVPALTEALRGMPVPGPLRPGERKRLAASLDKALAARRQM